MRGLRSLARKHTTLATSLSDGLASAGTWQIEHLRNPRAAPKAAPYTNTNVSVNGHVSARRVIESWPVFSGCGWVWVSAKALGNL